MDTNFCFQTDEIVLIQMDVVKEQLYEIADSVLGGAINESHNKDDSTILHIILSDSIQAINFVTLIEDEFEIEFEDDEIDMDFFISFNNIASLIQRHKNNKSRILPNA